MPEKEVYEWLLAVPVLYGFYRLYTFFSERLYDWSYKAWDRHAWIRRRWSRHEFTALVVPLTIVALFFGTFLAVSIIMLLTHQRPRTRFS